MKINHKIISLSSIVSVILVSMMVYTNYSNQSSTLAATTEKQLTRYNDIFWNQLEADEKSLEKLLTLLTNNERLIDTFLFAGRGELLAESKPIFEQLKKRFNITHLYFISAKGSVVLRAHNPAKFGDQLRRATFLQAQKNRQLGKGIEMGAKYFSLRVVMPIIREGNVVGYMELGEELDHLVDGFKEVTHADISLWVSGEYAQRKNLTNIFDEVSGWYRVISSDVSLQNRLINIASDGLARSDYSVFTEEMSGSHFSVKTFPFTDASGVEAGVLMIANNVTEQEQGFSSFMNGVLAVALIILLVVLVVSVYIANSIVRPLKQANLMLKDISQGDGDLTRRLQVTSTDEVGELSENFNTFIGKIWEMIGQVGETAGRLSSSSDALALATQSANGQIGQQAKETEQVAAAINQMSTTIKTVTDHAVAASSAAEEADKQSLSGKDIIHSTIAAIGDLANDVEISTGVIAELKSESNNIGSVLDVIKSIAEQTNLLALNAAIEAARAGEQGRGFAVVADEVRTLAQRTQQSTQEIEQMITSLQAGAENAEQAMNQIQTRASQTVEQASTAEDSLEAITVSVAAIKDMNTQIATATEQQSAVAEEINTSIHNIQQISQETSTDSHETMSSCQELASWGEELQGIVTQFKI